MRGARCALGGVRCRKGRWAVRPAPVIRCKHARRSSWSTTHRPPLSQERHNKHTRHHKSNRGAGRGAARLLGSGDTVPECTVCQATTTGGVPMKYFPQSALPNALTTRFHINPTVSETGELPATFATFAADTWPKQAIIVQNTCNRGEARCASSEKTCALLKNSWPPRLAQRPHSQGCSAAEPHQQPHAQQPHQQPSSLAGAPGGPQASGLEGAPQAHVLGAKYRTRACVGTWPALTGGSPGP